MVNLSRRLALDHVWVYKPADVVAIFGKFYESGKLDKEICHGYPIMGSQYLIDEWVSKGCEEILALTYMCANNAIPMLYFFSEKGYVDEFKDHVKLFVIEPFKALEVYWENPNQLFKALTKIHDRIARDYYWNKDLEFLEDQIIYVLDSFGKN